MDEKKVFHLTPETALSYSSIKKSVDFMHGNNSDGKYSEQIVREKNILKSYLTQIVSGS